MGKLLKNLVLNNREESSFLTVCNWGFTIAVLTFVVVCFIAAVYSGIRVFEV